MAAIDKYIETFKFKRASFLQIFQNMEQQNIDYQRIAEAIGYLNDNFKQQPNLNDVAAHVHLSPQHFQRIFTAWAGVSPKKFMQFLTIEYLRGRIYETNNLHEAADLVGFSAQSRVYDCLSTSKV
jgi:AraC family transcriptional regulator, regulatory protein of adaptative response / methylated-DNA-[protein]-cysteine methyltransferase